MTRANNKLAEQSRAYGGAVVGPHVRERRFRVVACAPLEQQVRLERRGRERRRAGAEAAAHRRVERTRRVRLRTATRSIYE